MNGRGGVAAFFLFLFLSIIILLQILSMVQLERFYRGINRLDEVLKNAVFVRLGRNIGSGMCRRVQRQ